MFRSISLHSRFTTSNIRVTSRLTLPQNHFSTNTVMPGKYAAVHGPENENGPGDARPTALQIIKDEGLEGKMSDKVFLVTGTSAGIGPETGRAFAATGGKVFMTVRDLKKGEEACKSFLEPGRVELLEMDNQNLDSVRKAAQNFLSKSNKLNVLVCNAGIMAAPYQKTKDGFESQFQTNHLSHFLLFQLLKDTMLKSSTPDFHSRVVTVSSTGHAAGEVQFGNYDFSDGKDYTPWGGYGQSKTANIYMTNEIENRYAEKGLHGISLHPGGIWSGLQKFVAPETMAEWKARPNVDKHIKSYEQGAATSVYAAVGKVFEKKGRLYLVDCDVESPKTNGKEGAIDDTRQGYSPHIFDKEKEARLWEDSLKMVGVTDS
ncbi:short chain dehydrogenase [Mollisia scopiformis]|uniref:Short chain dehydrogenase n=1 Tax=Mollisia scopiformis TaxID=149040 RepID=A0A132B326_MOLSC|nr:short chain dehydrogenase [Mollisia scopiformis]KUJ06805.1 short chain dehydrogenase [Mollisia scopiformis]